MPIEVAPIAHYHMGGIRVDRHGTSVPHLFAAGEAVGGANGANRLSGNAITEALVFGERAGERAARRSPRTRGCQRPQRTRTAVHRQRARSIRRRKSHRFSR